MIKRTIFPPDYNKNACYGRKGTKPFTRHFNYWCVYIRAEVHAGRLVEEAVKVLEGRER